MPDPYPPPTEAEGWYDNPGRLRMTTDQVVEAAVRQELAKQSSNRIELEKEYEKKTGEKASSLISDKALERAYNTHPAKKR